MITLNLARLPHLFVAGMSGAGKTRRLLRPLVAQAIADGYTAVLMNESGSDFSPFYSLPQAAIVRGDVYSYMAVLEAAMGEMTRREKLLRDLHVSEWRRMPDEFYLQHPFVLLAIDELLALQHPTAGHRRTAGPQTPKAEAVLGHADRLRLPRPQGGHVQPGAGHRPHLPRPGTGRPQLPQPVRAHQLPHVPIGRQPGHPGPERGRTTGREPIPGPAGQTGRTDRRGGQPQRRRTEPATSTGRRGRAAPPA
jgi:hypothetical protein